MKRSVKPPPGDAESSAPEERALAQLLLPPSTLDQLAEWREKVAARLSRAPKSTRRPVKKPPKKVL